ncbi:unnamed protein product (macronuclear) [Paramecium tetraurelia]|uniref:Uncharacterized protein n=1 Tax=Paramecium tetraurelia TaxID=5888 RepID=A0DZG2_PARTE|nr:uncharacterized protein GSPATT00021596001 [Paramecium tetraurelia]CAK88429.1 unnamed protein product [Paramecium tetraurelia]|eukprot:XP_001455826.1 hypothetical protein (macronuclear) [Paramecium tetraurelia strain d4-2]
MQLTHVAKINSLLLPTQSRQEPVRGLKIANCQISQSQQSSRLEICKFKFLLQKIICIIQKGCKNLFIKSIQQLGTPHHQYELLSRMHKVTPQMKDRKHKNALKNNGQAK